MLAQLSRRFLESTLFLLCLIYAHSPLLHILAHHPLNCSISIPCRRQADTVPPVMRNAYKLVGAAVYCKIISRESMTPPPFPQRRHTAFSVGAPQKR